MDKAELLDFIRSQRELASSRSTEHGITQWAVIAGLLYVVLEFVSDSSPLSRLQTDWQTIFGYYALAQFALMAAYMVVTPDRRYAANRAFENRVEGSFGSLGVFRFITWMTLIFAAPALCAHVAARHAGSGTLLGIQLAINEWTAWALLALLLAFAAVESVAFWRTGFPPPPLPRAKTRLQSASMVLMNLLMLELFAGNLFLLVRAAVGASSDQLAAIRVGCVMALFVLGFLLLWRLRSAQARMEAFDALERDVIFHDLRLEQAKLRIAEEYLVHEMGEWLTAKVESLKGTAADLIAKSERAGSIISEVEAIDPKYATERRSRQEAYLSGIERALTSYDKQINALLNWLELAQRYNKYPSNPSYERALNTAISSMRDTHASVSKSSKEAIRQLKAAEQKP